MLRSKQGNFSEIKAGKLTHIYYGSLFVGQFSNRHLSLSAITPPLTAQLLLELAEFVQDLTTAAIKAEQKAKDEQRERDLLANNPQITKDKETRQRLEIKTELLDSETFIEEPLKQPTD